MIFNSIEYALFLPLVFVVYWLLGRMKDSRRSLWLQNLLVLGASYVFYGWWNWRFLMLIAFTSGCSYASGLLIGGAKARWRKAALWGNIVINIGILGLFKYYDFFAAELAGLLGVSGDSFMLHLVLPVGISFYTFQALSYSIDVYKGKLEPTRDVVAFFAYIAFFPQLVAGPIERATNLLPQFRSRRVFDYGQAVDGCRQILWGLFKKMVVADNCAAYVDTVFASGGSGSAHLLAAVLFTFQIYGDFSGYSDIAIGSAKLFGIRLMQNFRTPYFSRDIAEFWRRWHISLTTWFRDYIYIPLGGSRVGRWKVVRNTFVIFLVSGLWHGANWTFLAWGFYHACLFLPLILMGRNRKYTDVVAAGRWLPTWKELGQMALTFLLAVVGWIIFRASSIENAVAFMGNIIDIETVTGVWRFFTEPEFAVTRMAIGVMIVVEWLNRDAGHGLQNIDKVVRWRWVRYVLYAAAFVAVVYYRGEYAEFIYFQF